MKALLLISSLVLSGTAFAGSITSEQASPVDILFIAKVILVAVIAVVGISAIRTFRQEK